MYCSGKYSLLKSVEDSHVSVPMMISGSVISRNVRNSAFLFLMLQKLMLNDILYFGDTCNKQMDADVTRC